MHNKYTNQIQGWAMFSRKELYYQGQTIGETFLDTPGIFQFNRLIQQLPGLFLQNDAAVSVMHKRSIVINDWGDELENEDSLLRQYIAMLLDEGFPIYQIQADKVVPIPNLRALKPIDSDVLNERAVYELLNDNKLFKDKVYLLTHDKIAKLGGEVKLVLERSKDWRLNPDLPSVNWLVLEKFDIEASELEAMLQQMPNLEKLQLKEVMIEGEFKSLHLPSLKQLSIENFNVFLDVNSTAISSLVNQLPNLVSLELDLTNSEKLDFSPKPSLRLLKLARISIEAKSLEALLSESLVQLELNFITLKDEMTLSHSLNHLVRLKTSMFNQSTKTWNSFIDRSPNVQELILKGDWYPHLVPKFHNLQSIQTLGNLVPTEEEAIEELQRTHTLKLEADIGMNLPGAFIRYRQTVSAKASESVLILSNIRGYAKSFTKACPWIKNIVIGDTKDNYPTSPENASKTWILAKSVKININDPTDWENIQVLWQNDIEISIGTFTCKYTAPIRDEPSVLTISGTITAEYLGLLLRKLPKDKTFVLILNGLSIIGELKEFPDIRVNTLSLKFMQLQTEQLEILTKCIHVNYLYFWQIELGSPLETKNSIVVDIASADQYSWNNGLFALLKPHHLKLLAEVSEPIKANEWVKTLECANLTNQQTLNAINKAFRSMGGLTLNKIVLDRFKEPTKNRFNVDELSITCKDNKKNSSLLGIIQQFPKLKWLRIKGFSRTLLLDFKKCCPDLKEIKLEGNESYLRKKDLSYLINALPKGCKISLENFIADYFRDFVDKHPQIVTKKFEIGWKMKPIASDFKPHDPNPTILDPNWNQGMLINRLIAYSAFLSPTQNTNTSTLKKGICSAVSKWFADTLDQKGLKAWNDKWKLIKSWDKKSLPPENSPLRIALEELKTYVWRYQLYEDILGNLWDYLQTSKIITNDLNKFLESTPKKPLMICNAWHRTCLIYQDKQWIYFDPNYKKGEPQCFNTKDEALREIGKVMGQGLSIISFDESLSPCWNETPEHINAFLETGGFGLIITDKEALEKLKDVTLSQAALEGLFLLNTNNIPFWYFGLTQDYNFFTGNPILELTIALFIKYNKLNIDAFENALKKGMGYLDDEKRQVLRASLEKCKNRLPKSITYILQCMDESPLPVLAEEAAWLPEKIERPKLEPELESKKDIEPEPLISKKSVQLKRTMKTTDSESTSGLVLPSAISPNELRPCPLTHPFLLSQALAHYQKNPTEPSKASPFKTWVATYHEGFSSLKEFDNFLSKHHAKNLLLRIPDSKQSLNYLHHLQASQLMKTRGLFVINSFDDLHCAISSIKIDASGKGSIKPPNSGPLYDFLMANAQRAPLIAINWSNFTLQQLIAANTVIDKSRHVDNVKLPKEAIVLGLQNPANAYLGSDFSSRHESLYDFPNHLEIPQVELPQLEEGSEAQECILELYGESNWEVYFYGYFKLTEEGFVYKKSALLEALETKPQALTLVLKNAPFHIPQFKFAFNSLVSQGYCMVNGLRFELPGQCGISLETGFNFKALFADTVISMERGYLSQADWVLNPDSLAMFTENYLIIPNTKTLITLTGLLENHPNQTLSLCITSSLSLGAYAKVLEAAKANQVKIKFKVAPGIVVPEEIVPFLTENKPIPESQPSSVRLMVTNDIHGAEIILQEAQAFDMCIDISEEKKDSILYALSGQLVGDKPEFDETLSDIWKALLNKKRVLLKGHFSQALVDALALILKPQGGIYHNGQWEIPTGELVLLTDSADKFSFCSQVEPLQVSFETKMALLGPEKKARLLEKYKEENLNSLSYAYLESLALAKALPDKPKELMNPLLQLPDLADIDEDFGLEEFKAIAFKQGRYADLLGALECRPTVFVSGETGTGKSSCMHDLEKEPFIIVIFNDIEAWLKVDPSNKIIILFIDEANLVNTDWLCFEGLYGKPPCIFYKGRHYVLGDNFKVVFAGNPANYSQDRRLPELFQNHPNTVVFGAMNNAYLYHEVLKPILGANIDAARLFLKTFQAVKKLSKEAISARELQMMAYLFQTQKSPLDISEKAKLIAFAMANQVLPKAHQPDFNTWFKQEFGELKPEVKEVPQSIGPISSKRGKKKMLLTPSHQEVYHWLNHFMEVRSFKQQGEGNASFGGLSGLVLEGEPGLGKSYLVKAFLVERGFSERKFDEEGGYIPFNYEEFINTKPKASQHFYYLPASLNPAIKMDLLIRSFHEGAVVIIDEINASSPLEELTNALLMGEDLKGRRAIVPGFTMLHTQNPSSMAGRTKASLAAARRVIHCDFPTYTPEEMVQVLKHKGLDENTACTFVCEFLKDQHFARLHNLNPEPCFRNVLKDAKTYLKTGKLKIHTSQIQLPFAEAILIRLLNLDEPHHQDLLMQMRSIGYEKFFYVNDKEEIHFLPDMQGSLKQNVLDNKDALSLVSHLQEKIKYLGFREQIFLGNEALMEALEAIPLEDLALFLTTARFEQIDFLQLSLDLMELEKSRFDIVGDVFKQFCLQVDEKSATNKEYKVHIEKHHPKSVHYSKDRFFSPPLEEDKQPILKTELRKSGK